MKLRSAVGVALCLAAVAAIGPGAAAAGPSRSQICTDEHLKCFHVTVPIDRNGTVPGHIKLWVQEYLPTGHSRGTIFLLAGGPGQASTSYFDLTEFGFWARTMPGYTLVDFDPRGTGLSDPLLCHTLSAAGCAAELGPRRNFYRTVDNAMDLDAIRATLGAPKIAIYGASYGTDLAVTYARMYPGRVTRLLLDSVALPFNSLPLVAGVIKRIPATLRTFCARFCSGATRAYSADAVALARQVATKPLRGIVLQPGGRYVHVRIDTADLIGLLIDSDLYDGIGAELPAAVVAAKGGDPTPLLRLEEAINPTPTEHGAVSFEGFNAVYPATLCDDGPFAWQSDTPIAQRKALEAAALAKLPTGSFGPIGPAAAVFDTADFCTHWPVSTVTAPAVPDAYPNIPVLAVDGDLDLRSPIFEDRQLLTHFPRGHLLTVANSGHAPIADRESPCIALAIRRWLAGASVASHCAAARRLPPIGAIPATGPAATPPEALADVTSTVRDAEASWALTRTEIAGVTAGRLLVTDSGFELSGYGLTGGIVLDGGFDARDETNSPWSFGGVVHVLQHGSTIGTLAVQPDGTLDGTLDGEYVTANKLSKPPAPAAVPKPFPDWSSWAPAPGSPAHIAAEIAAHVGAAYFLRANGPHLDHVVSAGARFPYFSVAVEHGQGLQAFNKTQYFATGSSWAYTLCGAAEQCSLPGDPTALRGQVVRREGLELALYTFHFNPSVTSVVVVLPAEFDTPSEALYLTRSDLARQLHETLARTLPLTTPPLPTDADHAEAGAITHLTLTHVYFAHLHDDGLAGNELVLRSPF